MKKSLIIAGVLGLAMLVFCIINGVQIHQTKNSIRYTEEAVYGDVEEIKGIRFRIPNQFGSLAWLTQGRLDEGLKLTTDAMYVFDMRVGGITLHADLKLNEEVLPADENILGICNNDMWMVLTEKNKELFLYSVGSGEESYEKQRLWEVSTKIFGVHMEGGDENVVLIIDTEEEKRFNSFKRRMDNGRLAFQ